MVLNSCIEVHHISFLLGLASAILFLVFQSLEHKTLYYNCYHYKIILFAIIATIRTIDIQHTFYLCLSFNIITYAPRFLSNKALPTSFSFPSFESLTTPGFTSYQSIFCFSKGPPSIKILRMSSTPYSTTVEIPIFTNEANAKTWNHFIYVSKIYLIRYVIIVIFPSFCPFKIRSNVAIHPFSSSWWTSRFRKRSILDLRPFITETTTLMPSSNTWNKVIDLFNVGGR